MEIGTGRWQASQLRVRALGNWHGAMASIAATRGTERLQALCSSRSCDACHCSVCHPSNGPILWSTFMPSSSSGQTGDSTKHARLLPWSQHQCSRSVWSNGNPHAFSEFDMLNAARLRNQQDKSSIFQGFLGNEKRL